MPRDISARFSARTVAAYAKAGLPQKFEVRADASTTEIFVYDEIAPDGFGFGVTAGEFVKALATAGDGPVTVRINSPGGDVFAGLAMYNAIKARGNVTAQIDGFAASAASFVAMAADKVVAHESSQMMIHRAWGLAVGNAEDHMELAAVLEKIDGQIDGMYSAKCGKPKGSFLPAMTAETFYTGQEAMDAGLVDVCVPNKPKAPAKNVEDPRIAAKARAARILAAAADPAMDPETCPACPDDCIEQAIELLTQARLMLAAEEATEAAQEAAEPSAPAPAATAHGSVRAAAERRLRLISHAS